MQPLRCGKILGRNVFSRRSKLLKYTLLTIFGIFCVSWVIAFIFLPLIFMCSVELQRLLMFTNIGQSNDPKDYVKPYRGMRNFYFTYKDYKNESITIGVWHLVPYPLWNETVIDFEDALINDNYSIIMHFHGSGETRKDSTGMFSVLYNFFHIIAFDYRDFADSSPAVLSEDAVSRDSIKLYQWIRNKTKKDIYIWGHSLGTALGTLTVANLADIKDTNFEPTGLILEAPFTTMREELPVHPYGQLFAWMPWFDSTILNPLYMNGFRFETSKHILKVNCPIMMLHAEDDSIIPYRLGKKLSEIASLERSPQQGKVIYHQFPKSCGYDHFRIYNAPELPDYISHFIHVCDMYKNRTILRKQKVLPKLWKDV